MSLNVLGPLKTMLCGGFGGVALWASIFPADVVKSRVQVSTSTAEKMPFVSTLVSIARNEGMETRRPDILYVAVSHISVSILIHL